MSKDVMTVSQQIQALVEVSQNFTGTIARHEEMFTTVTQDVKELKKFRDDSWTINTYQQFELKARAHSHVADIIREKYGELDKGAFNEQFRPLIHALWSQLKVAFQVPRYSMVRVKQYDAAVNWEEHWKPIRAVDKAVASGQ